MVVLRGVAGGGVEDVGETKREKKSEEAALHERRRKMAALHLVVVRWSLLVGDYCPTAVLYEGKEVEKSWRVSTNYQLECPGRN
ncbi:hypothetical protein MRB53_032470 [Persea americana]|uniref:Uncharacterized protein n=1 Tax=Persea americana TaxID=3435 RepID=A0ACC2KRY1_PERAE|nr:hypothetical protein MRB53_032470 [Persea americana]